MLFDAEEYYRMGNCPWTFFAYPTSLSDDQGLPPDTEACELLSRIQQYGIAVAIWVSQLVEDTTYFACRKDDAQRLNDLLNDFESSGANGFRLLSIRSENLFAQLADSKKKS